MLVHIHKKHLKWQTIELALILGVASGVASLWLGKLAAIVFATAFLCAAVHAILEHKVEKKHIRTARLKQTHHFVLPESTMTALWCGLIIGGLAIGNFLFFFSRHGIALDSVPTSAPIYAQAIGLAGLTVILCTLVHMLHRRFRFSLRLELPRVRKQRLFLGYAYAALCTLLVAGIALLIDGQFLQAPTMIDWYFAALAAGIFIVIREFQLYDRKHHRKSIRTLHAHIQSAARN